MQCKTEADDAVEEVYGYQDEDGNTIVLPPGADIKDIMGEESKTMRLVQIRIPAGGDAKNWLNLVQETEEDEEEES